MAFALATLAPRASVAESTARFPEAPPTLAPPAAPVGPPPPAYRPYPPGASSAAPPAPPGYAPSRPPAQPGYVAPVVPGVYVPPAYLPARAAGVAPGATGYATGAQPPAAPLVDDGLRYRQELGAYRRRGVASPGGAPPVRTAYVRVAPRRRRYHDGLYLRVAFGLGAGRESMRADRTLPSAVEQRFVFAPFEASAGALAPVTELAVGFAPWPGVTLGAGIYTASIGARAVTSNDARTGDYAFALSQLAVVGPFIDLYPDAEGGFHLQASPGVGAYVAGGGRPAVEGPVAQSHTAVGLGFMLGLGYEWWIADQWSLGVLGRFTFASASGADLRGVQWEHVAYAPAALVGLTYQ